MTIAPGLLPEGLRDRLPPEAEAASRLMHRVIVAIGRHGYARVSPPLAEFEESLVGRLKSSSATRRISLTAATLSLPISSAPACASSRSGRSWVARSLITGPP